MCLSFGGTRRHLPESPGFQNLVSFLEGGCTFSQLDHLSNCHPIWVTRALYMLLSAGFIFVTTMSTTYCFENGGLKTCKLP